MVVGWCDGSTAISGEVGDSGPRDKEDVRATDKLVFSVMHESNQAQSRPLPCKKAPQMKCIYANAQNKKEELKALAYQENYGIISVMEI